MNLFTRIIFTLILTLVCMACGTDEPSGPSTDDSRMVLLSLNVYAGDPEDDGSRAGASSRTGSLPGEDYFEGPQYDCERMRTLRVIIVRPNGTVEHNEFLYRTIPAEGLGQYNDIRLRVVGGETKKVYLFANESNMYIDGATDAPYDFNAITIGSKFPEAEISEATLSCTPGTPLIDNTGTTQRFVPMTESFDIDVKAPQPDGEDLLQSASLFITRAAVKFGFNFIPTAIPANRYVIEEIVISGLADREYLLPRATEYAPAKYPVYFADRYITQYTVPADASVAPYTFRPDITIDSAITVGEPIPYAPSLYFPETKLPADRSYTLKMLLSTGEEYSASITLPNLPSLPRNTYVKINISLGLSDINMQVDVLPYTAVPLNPEFGFDELLPRPPVIGGPTPPWIDIDPDSHRDN